MIELEGFASVTPNDLFQDPAYFRGMFEEVGVLGFRRLGLSKEEFIEAMIALNLYEGVIKTAVDHKTRFEQFEKGEGTGGLPPPADSTFLYWHLEDTYKKHPPLAVGVNMHTWASTIPHNRGWTGFVDMQKAYGALSDFWKEGLENAIQKEERVEFMPENVIHHPHSIVEKDWGNGKKNLILHGYNYDCTILPQRIDPESTSISKDKLWDIHAFMSSYVDNREAYPMFNPYTEELADIEWWPSPEENRQKVWQYNGVGDLLLWNTRRMSHACGAGWELGERIFDRVEWNGGHPEDVITLPPDDWGYDVPEGHDYHG